MNRTDPFVSMIFPFYLHLSRCNICSLFGSSQKAKIPYDSEHCYNYEKTQVRLQLERGDGVTGDGRKEARAVRGAGVKHTDESRTSTSERMMLGMLAK